MKKTMKSIAAVASLILCNIHLGLAQWLPVASTSYIYNTNPGSVNIGTGNVQAPPNTKLYVKNGNILLDYGGSNTTGNLYFGGQTDLNQSGLRLSHVNTGSSYIDARTGGVAGSNGLIFRIDALGNANTERMRINANGYVGIGVTNPWCRTHINGDLFVTGTGKNGVAGTASLLLGDNDIQPQFGIEYQAGLLNFWKPFGSTNGSGGNGFGNYFLVIKDNGKVGVHTDNPTADFTVNGNMLIGDPGFVDINTPGINYKLYVQTGILTEKLVVAVANSIYWADYVFDKNYKLMPIHELEAFIKDNKHLPNVPSANEVVKSGIDVAKMDAKLLEKIEELTLYIIEQNKRIEALENKLIEGKK